MPTNPLVQAWMRQVHDSGLAVGVAHAFAELNGYLQTDSTQRNTVVILAGKHNQNCTVASYLSGQAPTVGIIGVTHEFNSDHMQHLVQSGVDYSLPLTASPGLVLAVVLRLFARSKGWNAPGCGESGENEPGRGYWYLSASHTVIVSPQGKRIPLSWQERLLFQVLLQSDDLRVDHRSLLDALNAAATKSSSKLARTRLSVVISRLRKKFERYNEELPISSVHRWGYMFTGSTQPSAAT